MKNIFRKLTKDDEPEDLDEGYNEDYYGSAYRGDYGKQDANQQVNVNNASVQKNPRQDARPDVFRPASAPTVQNAKPAGIFSVSDNITSAANTQPERTPIKHFTPQDSNAGRRIVGQLVDGSIVIINIKKLERSQFMRLFDYIMGAVQAIDGEMTRMDSTTVVVAPHGTDLSSFDYENNNDDDDNDEESEDDNEEDVEDEEDGEYDTDYSDESEYDSTDDYEDDTEDGNTDENGDYVEDDPENF